MFPPGEPLTVYIENRYSPQSIYYVTEDAVTEALKSSGRAIRMKSHAPDQPDLGFLAEANIFVGSGFSGQRLGEHGKKLKLIHCTSAGVDAYLPMTWLPAGATFINSSGIHVAKASEYGLLALLMLNDHIPFYAGQQRERRWKQTFSTPIQGKRVLLYGVGEIGGGVAQKAKLLGLEVLGIRRSGEAHPHVDQMFKPDALPSLLSTVDFVVITCALTPETRGAFGAREIGLMKRAAGLINMARAAVVDYEALRKALETGALGGAMLDVFQPEPLAADSPLWHTPNLFITPHVSSDDPRRYIPASLEILTDNLARAEAGRPLRNVIDPVLGY